jgi:hypothetical protein
MWLPVTISEGTPRAKPWAATAGEGTKPQSTTTPPASLTAAAQAAMMRGVEGASPRQRHGGAGAELPSLAMCCKKARA